VARPSARGVFELVASSIKPRTGVFIFFSSPVLPPLPPSLCRSLLPSSSHLRLKWPHHQFHSAVAHLLGSLAPAQLAWSTRTAASTLFSRQYHLSWWGWVRLTFKAFTAHVVNPGLTLLCERARMSKEVVKFYGSLNLYSELEIFGIYGVWCCIVFV
jgi:hypothetical protein